MSKISIYIEGGPNACRQAVDELVDLKVWIHGRAFKEWLHSSNKPHHCIQLTQRKRWFGLFGPVVQTIRTFDATNNTDYFAKVCLPKA